MIRYCIDDSRVLLCYDEITLWMYVCNATLRLNTQLCYMQMTILLLLLWFFLCVIVMENAFRWWRHQMETFTALLAICAGNSPATGEFPIQKPVTRILYIIFDVSLNKRLSKQSWGWWFETPLSPLWRHSNAKCWCHPVWWPALDGYQPSSAGSPHTMPTQATDEQRLAFIIAVFYAWVRFITWHFVIFVRFDIMISTYQ